MRFRVPYKRDNSLNTFGDYTSLTCERTGNSETGSEVWMLVGPCAKLPLTEDERTVALKNFFFQQSQKR